MGVIGIRTTMGIEKLISYIISRLLYWPGARQATLRATGWIGHWLSRTKNPPIIGGKKELHTLVWLVSLLIITDLPAREILTTSTSKSMKIRGGTVSLSLLFRLTIEQFLHQYFILENTGYKSIWRFDGASHYPTTTRIPEHGPSRERLSKPGNSQDKECQKDWSGGIAREVRRFTVVLNSQAPHQMKLVGYHRRHKSTVEQLVPHCDVEKGPAVPKTQIWIRCQPDNLLFQHVLLVQYSLRETLPRISPASSSGPLLVQPSSSPLPVIIAIISWCRNRTCCPR